MLYDALILASTLVRWLRAVSAMLLLYRLHHTKIAEAQTVKIELFTKRLSERKKIHE